MKIPVFIRVAASLLSVALPTQVVSAQTTAALVVSAGSSIPITRLRQTESAGFGGAIGFLVGSIDNPFGLRLDAQYDKFAGRTVGTVRNEGSRVFSGTGNVVFTLPGNTIKPYGLAGIGQYRVRSDSTGAKSSTRFGFDFGAGASFPLIHRAALLEGRLHSVSQTGAKPLRYLQAVLGFVL